jgi:hypothetical protein
MVGLREIFMEKWEQISIGAILSADIEAHSWQAAQYDRIRQYRSMLSVADLAKTIHRVWQLMQENVERLRDDSRKAALAQDKQKGT